MLVGNGICAQAQCCTCAQEHYITPTVLKLVSLSSAEKQQLNHKREYVDNSTEANVYTNIYSTSGYNNNFE